MSRNTNYYMEYGLLIALLLCLLALAVRVFK